MALNNKQIKAIELLVYSPHMTQIAIAEEVGVHRETIRRWREEPEFQEELSKATRARWKAAEQAAVSAMLKLMDEGSYQATKYVLDSMDYGAAQKIDANVTGNQNIIITIGDEEEE